MRFTKSALLVLFTVIISSIFVAKVSNLISTENRRNLSKSPGSFNDRLARDGFGTTKDHLMWFVQVRVAISERIDRKSSYFASPRIPGVRHPREHLLEL